MKVQLAKPAVSDKPKRRWFQFTLRGLMLLVLVVGLGLGGWTFHANNQIRREQQIDRAVQLLGECPDPRGFQYNPVPLIRAVNHLQSMGQEDAIKALRRVEVKGLDSRAQEALQLVIPLLFLPKDPENSLPSANLGRQCDMQKDPWGNRINVEQDIPFHTEMIHASSGPPPYTDSRLVEWAEREGRIRATPLRAADDLIGAADAIIERLHPETKDESGESYWTRYHIREQVYAALETVLPKQDPDVSKGPDDEPAWNELKRQCQTLRLHWNEELQNYVIFPSQAHSRPRNSPMK